MSKSLVIIGFGFESRSGKDECANYLARAYGGCNIMRTSFAQAIRFEVHQAVREIAASYMCPPREAIEILCYRKGVVYDPFAIPDELYPYGKQRALFQYWGMKGREQDSGHWIVRVQDQIEFEKPDIVLLSDLRFRNEAAWIKDSGGYTVKVTRHNKPSLPGETATHISETELIDYAFDYEIVNDGSLASLHGKANGVIHKILQGKLF